VARSRVAAQTRGRVPVWSLSCFYVRKGYRNRGVTSALIAAALKAAKRAKAPALEAYRSTPT
jgi:GNAT superfamily N-acetyltransferase